MKKFLFLIALIILKGCSMNNVESGSNNKILTKPPIIPLEDFFKNPEKSIFKADVSNYDSLKSIRTVLRKEKKESSHPQKTMNLYLKRRAIFIL